jgi:predicted RNA-binding protein with PIN domain
MARTFLLIDGYNLLHAAGLVRRRYGPGGFQRVRDQLLRLVKSLVEPSVFRDCVMVFDSRSSSHPEINSASHDEGSVRFSESGRDADEEIEELLAAHSSPRQVLVVSSDHRLQKAASRRKARWIDSEEFLRQLRSGIDAAGRARIFEAMDSGSEPPSSAEPDTSQTLLDADLEQHFLQTDVDEIRRSIKKRDSQ